MTPKALRLPRDPLRGLDSLPLVLLVLLAGALGVLGWLLGSTVIWPGAWRGPLFLAVVPGASLLYLRFRRAIAQDPVATYLALALPVGLLFCLYMPTIASVSWDGQIHFDTSMAMATPGGATYDKADAIMCDADGIYDVGLHPWGTSDDDWSYNWEHLLSEEGTRTAQEKLDAATQEAYLRHTAPGHRHDDSSWLSMNMWGRIPNALGLALGDFLGLGRLARYFLGRLTGYLVWCALVVWAMARVRTGKRLIMAIGLMPTMVFVAANYSYDPFSIGMIMVAFAGFAGELQRPERRLTLGSAAQILLPWFFGTAIKATFVPAALVLVLMPREKFQKRWQWACWEGAGVLLVALLVFGFASPFLSSGGSNVADDRGGETDIRPMDQVQLIVHEPLRYLGVMGLWLLDYLNPVGLFQMLPVSFCYLPHPVLWPIISAGELALLVWLTVFDRTDADAPLATDRIRGFCLGGILLAYLLSATSLYVGFTNYGAPYILGMQIRYLFVELYPLLAIGLDFGTRPRRWLQRKLVGRLRLLEKPRDLQTIRLVRNGLGAQGFFWIEAALTWGTVFLGFVLRF